MKIEAFLDYAWQTGVSVAILIGLVLLVRPLFARFMGARATYALWLLPFLRLFLPPIALPQTRVLEAIPVIMPDFSALWPEPAIIQASGSVVSEQASIPNLFTQSGPEILFLIWLAGALIWMVNIFIRHHKVVAGLRLNSHAASDAMAESIKMAQNIVGLRKPPEVRTAHGPIGPLVTCPWSPLLILPESFEKAPSAESTADKQVQAALIHELSHIRRRDLWAALAAALFRAVNWPNPLVHFAASRFRLDLEAACDEFVLARLNDTSIGTLDYARTLAGLNDMPIKSS